MHVIVGATGKTGRRLCANLLAAGESVRALGRDRARLDALARSGADCAVADVTDLEALRDAFSGASVVYLMAPTGPRIEQIFELHERIGATLAQAVKTARVSHAVLMSACGVHRETNSAIPGMRAIESRLRAVPRLNLALLRPGFFMENFYAWFDQIREENSISRPIGPDTPIPMIATRDIADFAARLMLERDFDGATPFELLGPRDHTMAEATAALGASIDRPNLESTGPAIPTAPRACWATGFGYAPARGRYLANIFAAFERGLLAPERSRDASSQTPTTIEAFAAEVFAPAYRAAPR